MNWVPRFTPPIPEGTVRLHYETVAFGTLATIWRRRRLILGAMAAGLALGILALVVLKKNYTADALIQLDFGREDQPRSGAAPSAGGPALDAAAIVESEARVLRSRAIARRVVDRLELRNDPVFAQLLPMTAWFSWFSEDETKPAAGTDDAIRSDLIALALIRNLTVTNDTRAYLINVAYTSKDAVRSALIVNTFTDEYLRNRMEVSLNAAQRTSTWLSAQIQATRTALDEAEASVNAYRRQAGVPLADAGAAQDQSRQELAVRLDAASRIRAAEETKLAQIKAFQTSGTIPSAEELVGVPLLQRLLQRRDSLKREQEGSSPFRPVRTTSAEAPTDLTPTEAGLQPELDREITEREREAKIAAAIEAALMARVHEKDAAAAEVRKRDARLKSLQLDAASLRDRLKLLTENYSQAVAAAGVKSASAQVVMRADPIPLPSGPNTFVILGLALFGSAGAGVGYSLLSEKRRTGFKSETDLTAETQAHCLAMVPDLPAVPTLGEQRIFGEAIGLACASMGIPGASGTSRVVLVTSSVPGEGKSDFGRAVAAALANKQMRTLIIDTLPPEPGRPRPPGPSLEDVLLCDPGAFFERTTGQPVVALRASGRMTTAEMQAGGRFAKLLQATKAPFDLVVLEAPPVLLMLDFLPLAGFADTVVHLVRWNSTPRRTVLAALKRLESLSVSIHGLVLTHVDLEAHRQYFIVDQCDHYSKYRHFYDRDLPKSQIQEVERSS